MTYGEIHQIGRESGKCHIDIAAYKMVQALIDNRIHEIKVHLNNHDTREERRKYQPVLEKLQKAEELEYHKILLDKIKAELIKAYETAAEHASIGLINAEYFGFTGKM